MQEWLDKSAADLGRAIGTGDVDPVALAEAFFARIHAHDLKDRIYARLTEDRALAEAEAAAARARAGQRLSLLDGVPVSWKDLFDTAGAETEAGSALLQGRVPEADAVVLQNATAMGLVLGGGGVCGVWPGPGGHRVGYRRVGAHPVGVERSGGVEDDCGPLVD